MIRQQRFDPEGPYRLSHNRFQSRIESADQRLLRITATSVNCDDMITTGQQLQTPRFVKPVTGQMKRRIVAGTAHALEHIKIEIVPGDCTRDF